MIKKYVRKERRKLIKIDQESILYTHGHPTRENFINKLVRTMLAKEDKSEQELRELIEEILESYKNA